MKKVLITGINSYIGNSLEKWLLREPDNYKVDKISLRDDSWKEKDFGQYDVVFHAVGIAHTKETKDNRDLYYKINRDLAYEVAKRAKFNGVKQFIFLSSMSVYGLQKGMIDENTLTNPKNAYGKSKVEAEELISSLQNDTFTVTIIRPPMVYGEGCQGNYPRLAKLALKTPFFPKFDNKRSMIYIDNLSQFEKLVIDNLSEGVFFPQNAEYVSTSEMVRMIAEVHGRKIITTELFNPLIKSISISILDKVFGDLIYDLDMSKYKSEYRVSMFRESIYKTEVENY